MERKTTYIRAWRLKMGHTLDDMAGRLAVLGVETTGATLSRIERGLVPYNQDLLEAIAAALDVDVGQLLEDDPSIPWSPLGDMVGRLDAKKQAQAEAVLRAMFPEISDKSA